jgi:hypothetical protein
MADDDSQRPPPKNQKQPGTRGPLGKLVDAIISGMDDLFAPAPVPVPIPVRPDRRRR